MTCDPVSKFPALGNTVIDVIDVVTPVKNSAFDVGAIPVVPVESIDAPRCKPAVYLLVPPTARSHSQ